MSRGEPDIGTPIPTTIRPAPGSNTQNAALKYKMNPSLHEKLSPLFPLGQRHAANKQPFFTRRSKSTNTDPE